ncbi:ead/Ea22-like family protein [Salmonella enterica]
MTIDKQALREVAEKATKGNYVVGHNNINQQGHLSSVFVCQEWRGEAGGVVAECHVNCLTETSEQVYANAEFIAVANPRTMLALLDENIQLQRGKDATEAVALALRDDMRQAREQLAAAERRIAEFERSETQLISERDDAESALNDAYKAVMGHAPEWSNWFSFENAIDEIELACELWRNQTDDVIQFRQRIAELEAKLETADKLQDSAFRDGLKAGFSYGQTDDQSGFAQCMSAYSTRAGIGVKQQEDSVDSDVGRNQPGMVVAVHIGAGDFVKAKGQVFEVEETDFDDHDVTLWFVGGNALKCAAGCPVEVVSAPVAAGIKVKE